MGILEFILGLIGSIIGLALGGYILFMGRQAMHLTLGIIGLAVTADLLAVFVLGLDHAWELFDASAWGMIGIALVVGLLGFLLGRAKPDIATLIIGFIAGADIALWFYDISAHFTIVIAKQSEQIAVGVAILILFIGGLLGLWLVRASKDEALILITMVIGMKLIHAALGLSSSSSWTAIIMITFALAGVLVQYALYIREVKGGQIEPEQHASSLAYFQNLELDL